MMGPLARRAVLAATLGLAIVALPKLFLPSPAVHVAEREVPLQGDVAPLEPYSKTREEIAAVVPTARPTPAGEEEFAMAVLSREPSHRLVLLFAIPLAVAVSALLAAKLVLK